LKLNAQSSFSANRLDVGGIYVNLLGGNGNITRELFRGRKEPPGHTPTFAYVRESIFTFIEVLDEILLAKV
jgi:hypothetical protein